VRLSVLCAGHADVDKGAILTPGSGDGTRVLIPVPMYLVETGDARILIDTGMHPVHIDDPRHTFGGSPLDDAILPVMRPEDRLERRLAGAGLALADVTHVVNTHLHFDHCGQNDRFAGTAITVQRDAYETAVAEDRYAREYFERPELRYDLVDGDLELVPGVELIRAPGHAPGLQAVLVRVPARPVLLCGDAIAVPEQLERDNWLACADPAQARASARRLARLAEATGATMLFGHDPAQWRELA
jgi:N-acyl homoserine lactone hydrolase